MLLCVTFGIGLSLAIFVYLSNKQVPQTYYHSGDRNGTGQVVASSRYLRFAIFLLVCLFFYIASIFSVVILIYIYIYF